MKKITIYIVVATLCLFFKVNAQNHTALIKPLKIGDTIPEAVWNTPLQVVNHSRGKKTITLNDFKGKLIILDFWGTYCGSCIAALPRMDSLNKLFESKIIILPVNKESKEKVESFSNTNPILSSLKIQSVVDATNLKERFPYTLLPHEVWIRNGVVKAITNSEYVNFNNINGILQSNSFDFPEKKDVLNFNRAKLSLFNSEEGNDSSFLYRTTFTAFKSGLPSISGIEIKKDALKWRVYAINSSILELYYLAYRQIAGFPPERIKINIPNTKLSQPNIVGDELKKWNSQNLYCYELILPATTEMYLWEIIRQDLNRYLGLNGRIEIREGKEYFILEPINTMLNHKLN